MPSLRKPPIYTSHSKGSNKSIKRIIVGLSITVILCCILYLFLIQPNIQDLYSFGLGIAFILFCIGILALVMYIAMKIRVSLS